MFQDKITVSYSAEILKLSLAERRLLKRTITVYFNAVKFINRVILKNKTAILNLDTVQDKYNCIEHLIHSTSKNKAKYPEFDRKFFNMPCYLRRDAISQAWGHMSSYFSNLNNYNNERYKKISNGKKFSKKVPTLNLNSRKSPTFFKSNMYLPTDDNNITLKLFDGKTWKYYTFTLKKTDCDYIRKVQGDRKNPSLEFRNNKFYIRYPFQQPHVLCEQKSVFNRVALAVDLGINTHATCSVIRADGTVIARKFITDTTDKDRMNYLLSKKRELQSKSGRWDYAPLTHIQHKINCYNTAIENYVSHEIIAFALKYNVDVIIFEHLSKFKGRLSEKIHYWRKKAIIKKVCYKAHFYGMRYSTVTPCNTSRLAYDGSGYVERGNNIKHPFSKNRKYIAKSFSICKFKNKKIYNCDLNAAYNIGARYLYREYRKDNPNLDKKQSQVVLNDIWELAG